MSDFARVTVNDTIRGDITLATHTNERHTLRVNCHTLELRHHPVTNVDTVVVGSTALTSDDYEVTPFGIHAFEAFPAGTRIVVTYTSGWNDGDEPLDIKEAMRLIDAHSSLNPDSGITEYREGDQVVKRMVTQGIPERARLLLQRWVRP